MVRLHAKRLSTFDVSEVRIRLDVMAVTWQISLTHIVSCVDTISFTLRVVMNEHRSPPTPTDSDIDTVLDTFSTYCIGNDMMSSQWDFLYIE